MKMKNIISLIFVFMFAAVPYAAAEIVLTEEWSVEIDTGLGYDFAFVEEIGGIVTTTGQFTYNYQGISVVGSYDAAVIEMSDTTNNISIVIKGTANHPTAPPPYNISLFTVTIAGQYFNGKADGAYSIAFSQNFWPDPINGTWTATRISGSGITGDSYDIYDEDQNCAIGDFELLNAIDDWAADTLDDFDLLDLIDNWAAGSYC